MTIPTNFLYQLARTTNSNVLLDRLCEAGYRDLVILDKPLTFYQNLDLAHIVLDFEKRGVYVDWQRHLSLMKFELFKAAHEKLSPLSPTKINSLLEKACLFGKLQQVEFIMEQNHLYSIPRKVVLDLLYTNQDTVLIEYLHRRCQLNMIKYSSDLIKLLHMSCNKSVEYIVMNSPFHEDHLFTLAFFGSFDLIKRYTTKVPTDFYFSRHYSTLIKAFSHNYHEFTLKTDEMLPQLWHVSQAFFDIYNELPSESRYSSDALVKYSTRTGDAEPLEFLLDLGVQLTDKQFARLLPQQHLAELVMDYDLSFIDNYETYYKRTQKQEIY